MSEREGEKDERDDQCQKDRAKTFKTARGKKWDSGWNRGTRLGGTRLCRRACLPMIYCAPIGADHVLSKAQKESRSPPVVRWHTR